MHACLDSAALLAMIGAYCRQLPDGLRSVPASSYGFAIDNNNDVKRATGPRTWLTWVEVKRLRNHGEGALIKTGVIHGPFAGMAVHAASHLASQVGR
jgi:hypothetical protein